MATRLIAAARRLLLSTGRPADTRHPLTALAMVLPCSVLLLMLFGGLDQLAAQLEAVAELLGR